jgi:hypothetical protein
MKAICYMMFFGVAMPVMAQQTPESPKKPPPACSTPEFRQLDFWVGEWDLWYDQGKGKPRGTAHNTITKNAYGACVITEKFSMPGFTGMSVSTFHQPIGQWRQTWVDDQGGYYDLLGGPAPENADHDFALELVHPKGLQTPYLRMTWKIEDKDHLVWRWQSHGQGKTKWTDRWVIHYVREGAQ